MTSRLPTVTVCSLICLITVGCAPTSLPQKSEVLNALSAVLLAPDQTCDELAGYFGLDFLKTVETPDQLGLDFDEQWAVGRNGNVLHIWQLPATFDRGTVVLSTGAAGDMACYLFPARLLVDNGWSVIMYDYQGFGQSEGSPSLATLTDDLETVVDWSRVLTGRERLTVMGISIGSIPSIAVGVRRPDAVNAVIIDSPVALGAELDRFGFLFGGRGNDIGALIDEDLLDIPAFLRRQAN
ncbi:MAG: alpha/beta fold hydrolase [Proteobacteria bacterium]|nr:alpha/beta fold hydrolase [Pseudomonadota bacterium]